MLLPSALLNQTNLVIAGLAILIVATLRRQSGATLFSLRQTNVLRALAILAVIANHVGYFLVTETGFLAPYRDFAAIAVDLFLLLSGFGLTSSWIKKPLTIGGFYKKRLLKIFVPLWIVLVIFVVLDAIIPHLFYRPSYLAGYAIGLVTSADILHDFNSPLWFLTPLLGYYLIFPWVFKYTPKYTAPILLGAIGWYVVGLDWQIHARALELYRLHWLAFPLGCCLALFLHNQRVIKIIEHGLHRSTRRWIIMIGLMLAIWFSYPFVAAAATPLREQLMSIAIAVAASVMICLLPFSSRGLEFIGTYSYEIYLLHWPLLYRYDPLYATLPIGLATLLSIAIMLVLSIGLSKIAHRLTTRV